jgi:glycosyltransferase involved in cell wall biosynthesis
MNPRLDTTMRILIIHRYFWPDTPPYASMVRMIAQSWARQGHEVHVYSSQPSYKDSIDIPRQPYRQHLDELEIFRCRLIPESKKNIPARVLNSMFFCLGIILHAVRRDRYDIIMSSTMPPVLCGWAVRIASRLTGAASIYHCMDLYPEVGLYSGMFKSPRSRLFKLAQRIDARTCDRAAAVVVLSGDMANTLCQRPLRHPENIHIINNFNLPKFGQEPAPEIPEWATPQRPFRILFAGNIGRFQGLETVINAAILLEDRPDIEFVFVGDGAAIPTLKAAAGSLLEKSVFFYPHQSLPVAEAIMQRSSVCLVSLQPGIYKVAYPSKMMTCLSTGTPLLVMAEEHSEIHRFTREQRIGMTCPPDRPNQLADTIRSAADHPEQLAEMRGRTPGVFQQHFAFPAIEQKWSELLEQLGNRLEPRT